MGTPLFQIFFFLVEWSLVAEKKECDGSEAFIGWVSTLEECAKNVYGLQCFFTAQMTSVEADATEEVASVFVNQVPQLLELVTYLIITVIDFINTKLQVTSICLSKSNNQTHTYLDFLIIFLISIYE